MRHAYTFSNLCGNVYRQGNVVFSRDGNTLFSPVGNRVSAFELTASRSYTFPFEARANITRLALSPDGGLLLTVDEDGYALLVNVPQRTVLHHLNLKGSVGDAQFSPDGKLLLVAVGRLVQVWATPEIEKTFTPFNLHHTHSEHTGEITTLSWSADSRYFVTGSKDLTARVFTVHRRVGYVPPTLGGHRSALVSAFFDPPRRTLYTATQDGAILVWARIEQQAAAVVAVAHGKRKLAAEELLATASPDAAADGRGAEGSARDADGAEEALTMERWELQTKHFFERSLGSVASIAHCSRSARVAAPAAARARALEVPERLASIGNASDLLLAVGFTSGAFALYEMPGFVQIHSLSISDQRVSTAAINRSGEWLAFGCGGHGQLIVWEWASETYVLKQQGHFDSEVNALAFSAAGAVIATGGTDSKVKLWDVHSGFCFVTFSEHDAPVTGIAFVPHGRAFVSCSLDGTARAFDLVRYRNFQTFVTPTPAQLTCVAIDRSGEVVTAGSVDTMSVYVWSMQSAQLLEQLSGHAKPLSALGFGGPAGSLLASASWDGTVRLWDFVAQNARSDILKHSSDVLAIAFSPDGALLCAATLDGQLSLWDVASAEQVGTIDGRADLVGGQLARSRVSALNDRSGQCFRTLSFSADGELLLAAGRSKYACMYDVKNSSLLKRFQLSHNLSLDGVLDQLSSAKLSDAGALEQIDDEDDDVMRQRRRGQGGLELPGVRAGEHSKRSARRAVRASGIQFAPDGTAWAAATTEGLVFYSLDEQRLFDPTALNMEITPDAVRTTIKDGQYLKGLLMALRLNEADVRLGRVRARGDAMGGGQGKGGCAARHVRVHSASSACIDPNQPSP
jgi:periodic tryptophan protein 2